MLKGVNTTMSILISIIGIDDGSDEYNAAKRIKSIFDATSPKAAIGEIVLFPSATLFGQKVKDVDLVMIGSLKNCRLKLTFDHDGVFSDDIVSVDNFCTAIEIKSHTSSGIYRIGTDWMVKYGLEQHNVTHQNKMQKEDVVIRFCFDNQIYDVMVVNELLAHYGLPLLVK